MHRVNIFRIAKSVSQICRFSSNVPVRNSRPESAISHLFSNNSLRTARVKTFFEKNLKQLRCWEVIALLYQGFKSNYIFSGDQISMIAQSLDKSPDLLNNQQIGNAFYTFKTNNKCEEESIQLIRVLINKLKQSNNFISGQTVANTLFGIGNLTHTPQCRTIALEVYKILLPKIIHSNPHMSGREISNAIYGLNNMSSDSKEVKQLLDFFATKLREGYVFKIDRSSLTPAEVTANSQKNESSVLHLSGQDIAGILHGMQNMSTNCSEVHEILRHVHLYMTQKITDTNSKNDLYSLPYKPIDISMSLYGLHKMNPNDALIMNIIKELTIKLKESNTRMSAQDIASALYGIKQFACHLGSNERLVSKNTHTHMEYKEIISDMIHLLATKIKPCPQTFSESQIAMTMYSLSYYNVIDPSVDTTMMLLLNGIAEKIQGSMDVMHSQCISNVMFGLKGITVADSPVIQRLLHAITNKLLNKSTDFKNMSFFEISLAFRGLIGINLRNTEFNEPKQLIEAFGLRLHETTCDTMSLKEIGHCINGISNISTDHKEINPLLDFIVKHLSAMVDGSCTDLEGDSILHCIEFMYRKSSSTPQVREIIDCLTILLSRRGLSLSIAELSTVLRGLSNSNSDDSEVRQLLKTCLSLYDPFKIDKKSYNVYVILSTMKNMSSKHNEVIKLIEILRDELIADQRNVGVLRLSHALIGMKRMDVNDSPAILDIIVSISNKLSNFSSDDGSLLIENKVPEELIQNTRASLLTISSTFTDSNTSEQHAAMNAIIHFYSKLSSTTSIKN